jgi:hypothetical protein
MFLKKPSTGMAFLYLAAQCAYLSSVEPYRAYFCLYKANMKSRIIFRSMFKR